VFLLLVWGWLTYPLVLQPNVVTAIRSAPDNPSDLERDLHQLSIFDQDLSIANAYRNSESLIALEPSGLLDNGTCYPRPRPTVFGEHQIENGILAILPNLAGLGPVGSFNIVWTLMVLIAGLSMFALVMNWTGSFAAAAFAATAFALHPERITNLSHPAVAGTHWIPLVVLAMERVAQGRSRWGIAILCVITLLQALVGAYPLITMALFVGTYAGVLLLRNWKSFHIGSYLRVAACFALPALPIIALLRYYAATYEMYGVHARTSMFGLGIPPDLFLPGRFESLGVAVLLFAVVALFVRETGSPKRRLALVSAIFVCFALSVSSIPLGIATIASPISQLGEVFAPLRLVRAPGAIGAGVAAGACMLAGLGASYLLRNLQSRRLPVAAVAALLLVWPVAELSWRPVAEHVFGAPVRYELRAPVRFNEESMHIYRAFDDADLEGAILDLPFASRPLHSQWLGSYLVSGAQHGRPIATCYNSYSPPTFDVVKRACEPPYFPSHAALRELAALRLRNIVTHHENGEDRRRWHTLLAGMEGISPVTLGVEHSAWRIDIADPQTQNELDSLTFSLTTEAGRNSITQLYELPFELKNESGLMWATQSPKVTPVIVEFQPNDGRLTDPLLYELPLVLPMTIEAQASVTLSLQLPSPPPKGRYSVIVEFGELGRVLQASDFIVS
jgi:hypothetical protein